jgi:hypothetical protein
LAKALVVLLELLILFILLKGELIFILSEGRYNLFTFKYGDKTQITNVGENCYEVTVKGNNDSCEILPATEKIMVEFFSKYKDFVEN